MLTVVRRLQALFLTKQPDQVDFVEVVNVQEAKTHLSRLLERVAAGEVLLLGKHGKPRPNALAMRRRRPSSKTRTGPFS